MLRPGLHIGTIKKNRFEPSHALALWLFPEDAKVQKEVEPDGTEAVKYLKGETLTGDTGMSAPCEKRLGIDLYRKCKSWLGQDGCRDH